MKKLFFFFSLFIFNFSLFAQWDFIHEGTDVKNVIFTSANIGWMAGNKTLLKTSNGGENWQTLPLDDDLYFNTMRFFNDTLVLATCSSHPQDFRSRTEYRICRSDDGGQSWHDLSDLPGYVSRAVFVTDSIFLYENDSLFRTIDAGQTWSTVSLPQGYIDPPVFINNSTGFMTVSNYPEDKNIFMRSTDSGKSWQEMPGTTVASNIRNLQFINDSTGYMTSLDFENYADRFYVTTDTGRSWSLRHSTDPNSEFWTLGVQSEDTLYAVFVSFQDSMNVNLKVSTDGGSNWTMIQELAQEWGYSSFSFDSKGRGYLVADLPQEYYAYPGAMVLKQSKDGSWPLLFSGYPLNTIAFSDEQHGFAAGGIQDTHFAYGDILKTTDGGKSWQLSFSAGIPVMDLVFKDALNGFALASSRSYSYVLKTTNGGDSWYRLPEEYPGINQLGRSVFYFKDEKQGWLAGDYSDNQSNGVIILKTVDGGESWNTQWKLPNSQDTYNHIYDLQALHSVVWAIGEEGLMVKSVDSSSFTVLEKQTDLPLNKILVKDENHCWISGGYYDYSDDNGGPRSVFLWTSDGGKNWQIYNNSSFLISDMFFTDYQHGWAVGVDSSRKGIILETEDGGENWLTRMDGLRGRLNDLYFNEGTLWAVGESGLVLKKENVTWIDQKNGAEYPSNIQLSQNYPNPFNNSTMINYQLAATSDVTLSIYNLLGQKVATLVNKKQQAGSYNIEWNASGFTSGIYFYTLEITDSPLARHGGVRTSTAFRYSRKLLLLK